MQLTPEVKAQLEEQKKQCVYCKIIAKQIPAKIVFEDEKTLAILDIYPAVKGHVVFLFKEHYPILPFVPPDDFRHYFGLFPGLCQTIKEGMVSLAINTFLANGGIAGQSFPHVCTHFLPRDIDDKFFNFLVKKGKSPTPEQIQLLTQNYPALMNNYFAKAALPWHKGKGDMPVFLQNLAKQSIIVHEDEKTLCVLPMKNAAPGHIEVYSKTEEADIGKLSADDAAYLFLAASFATSLLYEGLKAPGSNILLKSGKTEDNPEGRLVIHVLPRWQDDPLQGMLWQPKQPSYNLDDIQKKIADRTWKVSYTPKEAPKPVTPPQPIKIGSLKAASSSAHDPHEEIRRAWEKAKNG